MTHTYHISGMTCEGCVYKMQHLIQKVPGIREVKVDLASESADILMEKHIPLTDLQESLKDYPKYSISEIQGNQDHVSLESEGTDKGILVYKPLLIIFAFITGITLLVEFNSNQFSWMRAMSNFMAGFFLVFSFFKLLDLKGFADSYAMYDVIARRFKPWGYLYVFTELALGIAYLIGFNPMVTNVVTFIVMSVSIIGVLQSVLNKREIKCACLGAVFNLPMSTVTIVEDALMIGMSGVMIIGMI